MNADEILRKFYEIADQASTQESATLIRQLGELFYARLRHTSDVYATIKDDFQELSTLVISRLKDNERNESEKIEKLIERMHSLANQFMAVENKVDELAALVMQYFS